MTEQELDDKIFNVYLKQAGKKYGTNYVQGFIDGAAYSKGKSDGTAIAIWESLDTSSEKGKTIIKKWLGLNNIDESKESAT